MKLVRSGKIPEMSDQEAPLFPRSVPLVKESNTFHPAEGVPPRWKVGLGLCKGQSPHPPGGSSKQKYSSKDTIFTKTQRGYSMD